jgi:hypothetical protein
MPWSSLKDLILMFVEQAKADIQEFTAEVVRTFDAKVAYDALSGEWGAVESDWQQGTNRLVQITADATNKIEALAAEAHAAFTGALSGGDDRRQRLFKGHKPALGAGAGGNFDYNPHGPAGRRRTRSRRTTWSSASSRSSRRRRRPWEKEQLAQDTAQQYSLDSEADFWAQALKRTNLSAKDRFEIQKKWIAAEQALQKDRIAAEIDGYKQEIAEADKNAEAKLAILKPRRRPSSTRCTATSHARRGRPTMPSARPRSRPPSSASSSSRTSSRPSSRSTRCRVDEAEANAEFEVQMGLKTKGQLLEQERQFENQRYQIDLQALNRRKNLIDPTRDPVAYQQVNLQIEELERQHQAKLTQIDRQAALQRTQIERNAIGNLSSSWASTLSKMLTLQEGLARRRPRSLHGPRPDHRGRARADHRAVADQVADVADHRQGTGNSDGRVEIHGSKPERPAPAVPPRWRLRRSRSTSRRRRSAP